MLLIRLLVMQGFKFRPKIDYESEANKANSQCEFKALCDVDLLSRLIKLRKKLHFETCNSLPCFQFYLMKFDFNDASSKR